MHTLVCIIPRYCTVYKDHATVFQVSNTIYIPVFVHYRALVSAFGQSSNSLSRADTHLWLMHYPALDRYYIVLVA